jgi:hypothetical protein
MVVRHKKCVGEVSFYLHLELNTQGVLSVHTEKYLKD